MSGFFGGLQLDFMDGLGKYLGNPMSASGRDLNAERQALIDESQELAPPDFARARSTGNVFQIALTTVRDELPEDEPATPQRLAAARKAIDDFKRKVEAERQFALQRKKELTAAVKAIGEPQGDAGLAEAMAAERRAALTALTGDPPSEYEVRDAEVALGRLQALARRPAAIGALGTRDPGCAAAAGKALAVLDAAATGLKKGGPADAAGDRTWLSDAIDFGPLSATPGRGLQPRTSAALLTLCASQPALGVTIAKTAASAKYPDLIAERAAEVIELVNALSTREGGDKPQKLANPGKYACDLLRMGGEMGPQYLDNLVGYLKSGGQFAPDPYGGKDTDNVAPEQMRSVTVADKLLRPGDGPPVLALDSPEAQAAIGDLLFHPDAVKTPMPALNEHLLRTVEYLRQHQDDANALLARIAKPATEAATGLVEAAFAKRDAREASARNTGAAVLAATLKPITQGSVGSCFATGPARRLHEEQPLEAMKAFAQIATTGFYAPGNGGPAVPAVIGRPDKGDPLQYSWQYSLATSAAAAGASVERTAFAGHVAEASKQLTGDAGLLAGFREPSRQLGQLKQAIEDHTSFVYDPTAAVLESSDGSSTKGRFILTLRGSEIRSKEDFQNEMLKIALASLKVGGLEADAAMRKKEELKKTIESDAFMNAVCTGGYKPWELQSGGWGTPVTNVLRGGSAQKQEFLTGKEKQPEGERMKSMLSGLVQNFGGKAGGMVPMENTGHSFNALSNHESLDRLKGDSAQAVSANIDAQLVKPGQAMAKATLPAAQAAALFDQALAAIESSADTEYPERPEVLGEAAAKFRPKTDMTAQQLDKLIDTALAGHYEHQTAMNTKEWAEKRMKSDPDAKIPADERAKKQSEVAANLRRKTAGAFKGAAVRALGGPQFVFADTNWGGPKDQTFYVIAPDPTNGEPMLYQRRDPPGTLTVPDADSARGEWYCFR